MTFLFHRPNHHIALTALVTAALAALSGCATVPVSGNPGPIPPHIPHSPVPAARATAPSTAKPIVIRDNHGGNVMTAMARRAELEASGRPVEIRGYCGSACTIFITMPRACLAPDATVGFHAPNFSGTDIISPVGPLIAGYYRNGVRQKYLTEWGKTRTVTRISAREYVALDPQTRLCKS